MVSRLVIPSKDRLPKLRRTFCFWTDGEAIPSTILSHDKRVWRKTTPLTHPLCLPDNIIARPGEALAITTIQEGKQLPAIARHLNFAAVILREPRLETGWERKTDLCFGLGDFDTCDGKGHSCCCGSEV